MSLTVSLLMAIFQKYDQKLVSNKFFSLIEHNLTGIAVETGTLMGCCVKICLFKLI